ncbi:hypothetical protein [Methylobacterium dankookense]|uniref:Uncharacterized protein n=1 Tax=Methylobacterium dankookense TaxID=560405 RepID=A0A564FZG8_9HYPH|nr:hypothetical protein [Methylobacterium dankookense]GJD58505.1 hypothetical protein IFDJLNFL_4426 [Methylobacterium dankookense]VUF13186.1 hypothetical protein MTDSW087_02885 [Methylobacterium dankookense]
MTAGPVLVVVPTTAGPLVLRALGARPGLPTSAAFAAGDYRPLPWSGDYARLAAEGGPLSRLPGVAPGPYELRLSGSFDAGRSWEVPVCLAHGLVARGHRLTADPAEAELVVWATGAVDLDLAVLPGDYALLDKVERSRDLLAAAARADLSVLLPEGPEASEAGRILLTAPRDRPPLVLPNGTVPSALAALARRAHPPARPAPSRGSVPRTALAAGLAVLTALGAGLAALHGRGRADADGSAVADAAAAATRPAAGPEPDAGAAPAILVQELVAPAGSSCRRVAFGADTPERRTVPVAEHGRLRPSRLAPELCGLAFRPSDSGARLLVGPELAAAALPPTRLPDGAQAYFLREGARQNLVYGVQAIPQAGRTVERLSHALVR